MPKSAVVGHASPRHGRPRPAELPVVESQIAELRAQELKHRIVGVAVPIRID
jgi:hypothetical protein